MHATQHDCLLGLQPSVRALPPTTAVLFAEQEGLGRCLVCTTPLSWTAQRTRASGAQRRGGGRGCAQGPRQPHRRAAWGRRLLACWLAAACPSLACTPLTSAAPPAARLQAGADGTQGAGFARGGAQVGRVCCRREERTLAQPAARQAHLPRQCRVPCHATTLPHAHHSLPLSLPHALHDYIVRRPPCPSLPSARRRLGTEAIKADFPPSRMIRAYDKRWRRLHACALTAATGEAGMAPGEGEFYAEQVGGWGGGGGGGLGVWRIVGLHQCVELKRPLLLNCLLMNAPCRFPPASPHPAPPLPLSGWRTTRPTTPRSLGSGRQPRRSASCAPGCATCC